MATFEPRMGPEVYKTFAIVIPLHTHFRPATCAEIDCPDYLHGWKIRIEGLPPEMVHAAKHSGRRYSELHVTAGETWLVFEAGQRCFRYTEHRTRLDKPEHFVVRDGDHRGNPRGTRARLHQRAADWQEHFAEHQQGLADAFQRG
jgi:hypothetical protein